MRKETEAVIALSREAIPLGGTRKGTIGHRFVAWRQHGVPVQKPAKSWITAFMHPTHVTVSP